MECVAEIIKEIMEINGLSQQALADILELGQKTISNWVNGIDTPKASSMLVIYEKFGITPNELLGIDKITKKEIYNNIHHNAIVNINQGNKK